MKNRETCGIKGRNSYCYMCEVSLVVALALLQQCNSTTSRFRRYTTMLDGLGVIGR
jgi:hypothetical protein